MGKVNQANDSVNHGVAQGNQGIDGATGETTESQFNKIFHGGIAIQAAYEGWFEWLI